MWEPQVWAVILKGTNFGIKPVQAHSIFLDFQLQVGRRAWAKFASVGRMDSGSTYQWLKQTQKDLNILFLSASFSFNAVNVFFIFCQFLTWIILNITIWWINSSSLHFFEFLVLCALSDFLATLCRWFGEAAAILTSLFSMLLTLIVRVFGKVPDPLMEYAHAEHH